MEITSEADRNAYLDEICAAAPEIRRQVEALLAAHADAGSFLDAAAVDGQRTSPFDPVSSPYTWNLSNLYTTGEVTLSILLAGDYSGNGTVGPEDYSLWKANFGSTTMLAADGNGDGIVNAADYTVWRNNLGATLPGAGSAGASPSHATVPEPSSMFLLIFAAILFDVRQNSWRRGMGQTASSVPAWAVRS